jgi:hypothetical protein
LLSAPLMWRKFLQFRLIVCLFWLLGAASGFGILMKYQSTEGPVGKTSQRWPKGAQVILDQRRKTLVMFAHPQCPCTRASIEELNRLMAKSNGNLVAHVLFYRPKSYAIDWAKTDLWGSAAAIPGVSVQEDIDGAQAHLFGAETSGCVLLYDTHGQLLFNGGITESRGHAGDNAGENTIVSLVSGQAASLKQTPVFGCSLLSQCQTSQKGQTE